MFLPLALLQYLRQFGALADSFYDFVPILDGAKKLIRYLLLL
jgi:hypothetical protein